MPEIQRNKALYDASLETYAADSLAIRPKSGGEQLLRFNEIQREIDVKLDNQFNERGRVRVLIVKPQKVGASTCSGARFYYRISRRRGLQALIMAHEDKATANLFSMVRLFNEKDPHAPSADRDRRNKEELYFSDLNSGFVIATAGATNTGSGRSFNFQLALLPNAAEPSLLPAGVLRLNKTKIAHAFDAGAGNTQDIVSVMTVAITPSKVGAQIVVQGVFSGTRDDGADHMGDVCLRRKVGTGNYTGIHGDGNHTVIGSISADSAVSAKWETEIDRFLYVIAATSVDEHKFNLGFQPYVVSSGGATKQQSGTVYVNRSSQAADVLSGVFVTELSVVEVKPGGALTIQEATTLDSK